MATNSNSSNNQSSKDRLIFVYNADSGFLNMLKDWTHKVVNPSTYNCQLCALTYGHTGERKKWRTFISTLPYNAVFLHRDELGKQYPSLKDTPLPCIFIEKKPDDHVKVFLDAETLNKQETLDQLIDICTQSIESWKEH